PGQEVTLRWSGKNLSSLVIEDDEGNVIHTATPLQLTSGSLPLGSLPMGDYTYKIRAVGQAPSNQIERDFNLHVYDAYSLDSFTADIHSIELTSPRTPVTLTWETTN